MTLLSIHYQSEGRNINNLPLDHLSFLIGENASGKTSVLFIIIRLNEILTRHVRLSSNEHCHIQLQNDAGQIIDYQFETLFENGKVCVCFERLKLDAQLLIERKAEEKAFVFNGNYKRIEEIEIQHHKLALPTFYAINDSARSIMGWANAIWGFNYSGAKPFDFPSLVGNNALSPKNMLNLYNSLEVGYRTRITESLIQLSFENDVQILESTRGLDRGHLEGLVSSGFLRCFSLLTYCFYLIGQGVLSLLLVDNLCQGLDYERSKKFGSLLFETCHQNAIQLIAATNDVYLIDAMETDKLIILKRDKQGISNLNIKDDPVMFEQHLFSGLSNLDFLHHNKI